MTGMGRGLSILTVVLLGVAILSTAAAGDSSGRLRLQGPITLPADSTLELADVQALHNGDTTAATFTLTAQALKVRWFEAQYAVAPAVSLTEVKTNQNDRSWALTNVTVTLLSDGDQAGIIGYSPTGAAACDLTLADSANVEGRQVSRIPERGEQLSSDAPEQPYYWHEIDSAHVYARAPGSATCEGAGALKIRGFDVRITAAENATEWRTGREQPTPVQTVIQWLYLEYDAATFTLSSPEEPLEVAAPTSQVSWDGAAQMIATFGRLVTEEAEYEATGARISLAGSLTGWLAPVPGMAGALDLTILGGELRATGLAKHERAPAPLLPASWQEPVGKWWPLAAVGLAAVAGGAFLALHRHRQAGLIADRSAPEDAAFFEHYATLAEQQSLYGLALEWVRAARDSGHNTAYFATWEGLIYHGQGDDRTALACFEEASRLDPNDGDADCWAAVVLAQENGGFRKDDAMAHLRRALQRDPALAEDVQEDSAFTILHGPEFWALIAEAIERAEREGRRYL